MFVGSNMLVSLSFVLGYSPSNSSKQIREAKARGAKFIVIDPRRTEITNTRICISSRGRAKTRRLRPVF